MCKSKRETMSVNHIFIFTDNYDKAAQELIDFGFIEGSSRVHPGQGTQNRKFNFDNFFLEILWVHDENEINSVLTKPTKLEQRSKWKLNGSSPFGLCLDYSVEEDSLFENYFKYEPTYLPVGMEIQVLHNVENPTLPWTFRWKSESSKKTVTESIVHKNKIELLTKVCFGVEVTEERYVDFFKKDEFVFFEQSKENYLKLEFDHKKTKQVKIFDTIPLQIEY